MNKIRQQKLIVFLLFATGLTIAFSLIIYSLRQNLNVFVTPTELVLVDKNNHASFRLGGVVKVGSIKPEASKQGISFVVTDFQKEVTVLYRGMLPDLFREGKGVIAEGRLTPDGQFNATIVLAKHDENYMPKATYQALRKQTV